ncbi:hypothetical protein [Piscirickettsia salmonis]|uniref:hypothetical protein n=1 Tax=Piscirickettsia salmonis TaxID=1238 RepID=UPI00094AAC87|nr:hypothetical protein [Piscirickettsia salmonis]
MECADSRHVTLCDADSRGFIVVAFCSAILHHWMCKIPTEVATLTYNVMQKNLELASHMNNQYAEQTHSIYESVPMPHYPLTHLV